MRGKLELTTPSVLKNTTTSGADDVVYDQPVRLCLLDYSVVLRFGLTDLQMGI
jgi:hypothetical protein